MSGSDFVVDHEIHGVTPEMIDWWWDNMEKGYPLWCPEEHKSFVWQISPAQNGHVGAVQIAEESIQVKSMAVCAEMSFRAALMRTESRGWHFREDYPEHDDQNWLKWIRVKKEDGKMLLATEPVPIDKYKFKP